MFGGRNLLAFVVLFLVGTFLPACIPPAVPIETKESKLKKKRDELVEWKGEASNRRAVSPVRTQLAKSSYEECRREELLREEPKDCEKKRQKFLEGQFEFEKAADDRIDKIRREIKELEQSEPTIENK